MALSEPLQHSQLSALPTAHAQSITGAQAVRSTGLARQGFHLGTFHLKGSMSSEIDMTMTGALSVGQAHSLSWDLPAVVTTQVNGYSQQVSQMSYTFSVTPEARRTW